MKKILAILLILVLLVGVSCAGEKAAAPKKINMFMGGSSATSSWHMTGILMGHMWSKYVPEINITVVEGGGSVGGTTGVEDGRYHIAGVWGIADGVGKEIYRIAPFDEREVRNGWRQLFVNGPDIPLMIVAREDSGITSISQLHGRKVAARPTGTTYDTQAALKEIGIEPEYVAGSYTENTAAVKEGRVDAAFQTGSGYQVSAPILDMQTATTLRLLSWSEEEMKQVRESRVMPHRDFVLIPAGACLAFPEAGEVWNFGSPGGSGPATFKGKISQEIGYKMAKAMFEHWEELYTTWPAAKQLKEDYGDPIKAGIGLLEQVSMTFYDEFQKYHPGYAPITFHPGTVQYMKEKGYDVPALLIPEEYKG